MPIAALNIDIEEQRVEEPGPVTDVDFRRFLNKVCMCVCVCMFFFVGLFGCALMWLCVFACFFSCVCVVARCRCDCVFVCLFCQGCMLVLRTNFLAPSPHFPIIFFPRSPRASRGNPRAARRKQKFAEQIWSWDFFKILKAIFKHCGANLKRGRAEIFLNS